MCTLFWRLWLNYNDLLAASPLDTGMINFGIGTLTFEVPGWGGWLENPGFVDEFPIKTSIEFGDFPATFDDTGNG